MRFTGDEKIQGHGDVLHQALLLRIGIEAPYYKHAFGILYTYYPLYARKVTNAQCYTEWCEYAYWCKDNKA